MWRDKLLHERLALAGLAALALGAGAYAVVRGQRQPAPIVFTNLAKPDGHPAPASQNSAFALPGPQTIVVHATGAVKNPGVYRLPPESRVDDVLKAAGGSAPDADLENLNLAAKLIDGTQVFVPHKGLPGNPQSVAAPYQGGALSDVYAKNSAPGRSTGGGSRAKKEPPSQPISLNSADSAELQRIPGIGPATAQKILDYRQEHGRFTSVDELMAVRGIGEKKLSSMRRYLKL